MKNTLKVGMEHQYTYKISENKTVPYLYPGDTHLKSMPKIFATGFMVGLIEITCMQALSKHLNDGEGSVGIHIDVSHTSPTPPGMEVEVFVKVKDIEGNKVTWDITARDQKDTISKGKHQRFIVNWNKFQSKLDQKLIN